MTDEMLKDFDEAIGRLQATFAKHGLEAPLAIAVGSDADFHSLRASSPSSAIYEAPQLHKDIACKILGVALVHPLSVKEVA